MWTVFRLRPNRNSAGIMLHLEFAPSRLVSVGHARLPDSRRNGLKHRSPPKTPRCAPARVGGATGRDREGRQSDTRVGPGPNGSVSPWRWDRRSARSAPRTWLRVAGGGRPDVGPVD